VVIASRLRAARFSRIGLRLLAFNLLVVFVPVAGVFYLDVYEVRLREAQEATLAQQARVLAAALGGKEMPSADELSQLFARLERRSDARLRVYDQTGALVADSGRASAPAAGGDDVYGASAGDAQVRRRPLYRVGAWLARVRRLVTSALNRSGRQSLAPEPDSSAPAIPPEVRAALAGRYGAATRPTPGQRSITLFSAVPVSHAGTITGAVVASQSTFRILAALYTVRLRLFEIVIASLAAAAILTGLAATTIVRPLSRLRRQAAAVAEHRGPLPSAFEGAGRRDEIGSLARALGELSRRTNDHVALLHAFSADVSHELKNPLASIRTAAEMMSESDAPDERRRFMEMMIRDVGRLERLVSGLRDVARVERQIETDVTEPVVLQTLLADAVASADRSGGRGVQTSLTVNAPSARVTASPERLMQVFGNLLENAHSFAPAGSSIAVTLSEAGGWVNVGIADEGPGIPETHLTRIFDRFFSYRPDDERREHVGLGLAIAKQIVESYGGTLTARNRADRGAEFVISLPG
jgi:two-component system sensor histidine kinase ChvG